jgi:O-antigen/teichoic acid export membrane protein
MTEANHRGPGWLTQKFPGIATQSSSFWRNALFNSSASVVSLATQLFLVVTLANLLSIAEYAAYISAAAIVAVGEMASDFGARIWAVKQFATTGGVKRNLKVLAKAKIITSSVFCAGLLLVPFETLPKPLLLPIALIAITQPSTDPFLWLLRGKERLDIEASIIVLWRLTTAFLLVITAFLGSGIETLLTLWCTSNILRMFITSRLSVVRAQISESTFKNDDEISTLQVISNSLPIGMAFFAMTLFQRLGIFMLDRMGTNEDIAIYGTAFTLVASAGFVSTALTVSSFPSLAQAVKANDASKIASLTSSTILLVLIAMLCIGLGGIPLAPLIFSILYPDAFSAGALVMIYLLPGLLISSVNHSLKYTLNAIELNWVDLATVLTGLAIFSGSMYYAPIEALPVRAAFSWVFAELSIFLLRTSVLLWKRVLGMKPILATLVAFLVLETLGFILN